MASPTPTFRSARSTSVAVACLLMSGMCASAGLAEPPRADALQMRSLARERAAPLGRAAPAGESAATTRPKAGGKVQPPPAATIETSASTKAVDQATQAAMTRALDRSEAVLAHCYAIARKLDVELRAPIAVRVTAQSPNNIAIEIEGKDLKTHPLTRCAARMHGSVTVVEALSGEREHSRKLALGETAVALREPPAR